MMTIMNFLDLLACYFMDFDTGLIFKEPQVMSE